MVPPIPLFYHDDGGPERLSGDTLCWQVRADDTLDPVNPRDLGADLQAGFRCPLDPVPDQGGGGLAAVKPVDLAQDGRFMDARTTALESHDYTLGLDD